MAKRPKPLVLTILDGWGYSPETKGNAIALARKPNYDALLKKFPNVLIHTSGPFVGLPEGQMGNSEVGHLNIGAGRIVQMDITRIDMKIASGEFFREPLLVEAMRNAQTRQLHLLGLISDGGVHSHIQHLFALLEMAREHGVKNVFVHAFTDGRDTPPHSGVEFLQQLEKKMRELATGQIATVSGRYYAMDRDHRWERIEKAYRAIVHGASEAKFANPIAAVRASYEAEVTDEFIVPTVITEAAESARTADSLTKMRDGDSVIFFNFRADRAREMTRAIAEPEFNAFTDSSRPKNLNYVAMTQYEKTWPWLRYIQGPEKIEHILAQVFGQIGFRNLRCAETEKYAHVTYFFNGGIEKAYPGEERVLVPSPKVPTYDLQPEMSAAGITSAVTKAIEKGEFDVIIMNFANADMVGHTGKLEAAIKAVETVDDCLRQIHKSLAARGGAWMITADHGNAETMIDPKTGGPHTYHTTNPVPFALVSDENNLRLTRQGSLRDIAPTLLGLLDIPAPKEMTGRDLRVRDAGAD